MAKIKYLICHYRMTPVNPMVTSVKGWKNDRNNVQYDEQVFFDSRIRNKDQSANIILDLEKKIIEKNTVDPNISFQQCFDYFYKTYKQHMDPVLVALNQAS